MTHVPVLLNETAGFVLAGNPKIIVDATLGAGGHTRKILESNSEVKVIGIDCDSEILGLAEKNLREFKERVTIVKENYRNIESVLASLGVAGVDGAVFDLGVSSLELDSPERGFSFLHEAPLDMRMDREGRLTAEAIVNELNETELADIIFKYGEERFSRRIARNIAQSRERKRIETTTELAELVRLSVPPNCRHGRIHPATRTFQALRIAVNDELTGLSKALEKMPGLLTPGAKLCVISFHSLEDRIVKKNFVAAAKQEAPVYKLLTKKPLIPGEAETAVNPRSRSSKLRVAERI
ncbi:MAG: 16S rRNA (cytosine(1402)-N(4))-methyltransferase RsmH [Candidatus Firestonebacteria bacterium]